MPKNELLNFSVFVGGRQLEEHSKNGDTFVEADIFGPHARQETRRDSVDGEEETQEYPVVPYQIFLHLFPSSTASVWAFVTVDGFRVCRILIHPGVTKMIYGFRDGDDVKEFLFSLPRLGKEKSDQVEGSRQQAVGVIEVSLKEAVFQRTVVKRGYNDYNRQKQKKLAFTQATKRDSSSVTAGRYLMMTTRAGNCLQWSKRKRSNGVMYSMDIHNEGNDLGTLKLQYHIKSTLVQMGIFTPHDVKELKDEGIEEVKDEGLEEIKDEGVEEVEVGVVMEEDEEVKLLKEIIYCD